MSPTRGLQSSFSRKVLIAFCAAVFVVASLVTAIWRMAQDATDAADIVSRTHQVLNLIAQIRADTLQVSFTTQSFRLSGDKKLLEERDKVIATREQALAALKALVDSDAGQSERWRDLRAVVDQRLAIAKQISVLRTTQGGEAANAYAASAPLEETRERIYALFQDMNRHAQIELEQHTARQLQKQKTVYVISVMLGLLLAGLLAQIYTLIRRQLRDNEQTQRALAQSEASLSTTLRSLGDAVLETDALGRVTRMNPVAESLTGWQDADALGHMVDEVFHVIHESTRLPTQGPVAKVIETGVTQALSNDTLLIRRDGRELPIGHSAAPVVDASGNVSGVVLVFRDITVEHLAKQSIREQNAALERNVYERTRELQETQEHLRTVMNSVPAMIAYVGADQRYVYVNDQYLGRFTPERRSIAGLATREVLGEARYAIAQPHIERVLTGETFQYDYQPNPALWQSINYVPKLDAQRKVIGYYVLGIDITERKLNEEKIGNLNAELNHRVQELERVTRALKTLSAGNSAMLRSTDEAHLLDSMCRAIVEAGGYPIAMVWYRLHDEAQSTQVVAESGYLPGIQRLQNLKTSWADGPHGGGAIGKAIRTGLPQVAKNMLTDPHYAPWREHLMGNGTCIACPLHVDGEVIGTLAIFAEEADAFGDDEVRLLMESAEDLAFGIASQRARAARAASELEAFRLTHIDALTGLANGTFFIELLNQAIDHGEETARPFVVLQTNIERLSEINDALGFAQGDEMLKEFAKRLRMVAPDGSVLARLRGDEFAVLLRQGDRATAEAMVQRIEGMLVKPFPIGDIVLDVTTKTGIAVYPQHGTSVHDLLRHVDMAVRQAKRSTLSHAVYEPQLDSARPKRLNMAGALRRAIEGGDLILHLQPKVDMISRQIVGAEALVRWQHAEHGLIPPMQFIELAEHTGLIKPLTELVIDKAAYLIQDWQKQGTALPIAVNLSAKNLRDESLVARIRQLHQNFSIPQGFLELEITETALMDDAQLAMRVLQELKDEGVRLYIDDFGTGYSSLSYLQKLPVDFIKIDQSFIRGMSIDKDSGLIVRSTIDLTHDLGRKTVAEGVETQGDWDRLAQLGCDVAQGYFIARPMPSDQFVVWAFNYGRGLEKTGEAD